ncbi:hypothetical protein [Fluviibacter phosphoraccumulans]|uniref:Uncharacterized protein n=1 Tax=Fluviibacter phosphoraccumulans TaxID=1751046 RepID=A0A7R6QWP9_9RHOO|nr:hypothetical protein [Fluviibacter phosphoraccumulans]BBU68772.1 hypothetical protein ICHIAU1_10550 [Fluviibacter phosphoraccumulans]BBU72075.1 hypothetical protein ICHIJ1_19940 [Fluviibacter phosphoraccumulans]
MPKLFALQGPGNCGKSDTLIRLFQALQSKYPSAATRALYSGTKDVAVIMYGVNGLTVGIESQGDPNSRLGQTLPALSAANCDVIFCACRTSGMTVNWVNLLSATYSIHFVAQAYVVSNHSTTNAATALSLMHRAGI